MKLYLQDILNEIERIKRFVKGIDNFEEFTKNELVYYGILKCLENIGKAVKNIPEEVRTLYPLEWKKILGLRDILVHDYFGIDLEIIWDVIQNKLSELELAVKLLLKELEDKWCCLQGLTKSIM